MSTAHPSLLAVRLRRWLPPLAAALVFAAAILVLGRELRAVRYDDLVAAARLVSPGAVTAAFLLTIANYAVLTRFDALAFEYAGKRLPAWRVATAGFVGYAISNNLGFALLSGTSVRYRFYSRWGLTAVELSRVVAFYFATFWLGLLALGGGALLLHADAAALPALGETGGRVLGAALLLACVAYLLLAALDRGALRLGRVELPVPSATLALRQLALSSVDWALAAGVLFVLLPPGSGVGFGAFLVFFLTAQFAGLVSHVPGGVGVFEGAMLLLFASRIPAESVLATLVLYRVVYYLVPLGAALAVLVGDEIWLRRHHLERWRSLFGALGERLAGKVLGVFTFLAGALLLFSGATPPISARIDALATVLPLALLEASHFLGSIAGVWLLLVSNGVARRLDAAHTFAVVGLAVGIAASLLKGADYEEAALLALLLGSLHLARHEFDRGAAFFASRFSPGWVVSVLAVVAASIWLGLVAFRYVDYSEELWWHFSVASDSSRFLRASLGATLAVLAFGVFRLLRPAPPALEVPGEEALDELDRAIQAQSSTTAYLVHLRDKAVLRSDDGEAFIMYAVQGRTWAAFGDPVGEERRSRELVRAFVEKADDYGGTAVFYQVAKERLHLYADFGLNSAKVGEEARVPLQAFSLDGQERKGLRRVLNRVAREGAAFRVVERRAVATLLPEIADVSAEWLARRRQGEKGFSMGFFDSGYVSRFPVAVLERGGRLEAFASLWPGPGLVELSVDLMRFRDDAPRDAMEALLAHLMLWGKAEGYRWFNLGMAPAAGLESSPAAPLPSTMMRWFFEHGEALYNFRGVREFKEKFHPTWEPRYLVYPGGPWVMARVVADVSALIAGGYRHLLRAPSGTQQR